MNKQELFKKLQNMDPSKASRLGFTKEEIDFLKNKTITHKLGFSFDYTEMDNEDKYKYLVLTEDKSKAINPKPKTNLLIEGDNFHALKALKTAGVKVDIIYIDPPYNTGKEFVYNDSFTSEAKTVTSDDPHKHSKWLTFMRKRLEIAKELLSDDGVIFVSIDDYEQAYLKVLMDEIFGERNFLGNINWLKGNAQNDAINIQKNHEYILIFAKSSTRSLFTRKEKIEEQIYHDELGKWYIGSGLTTGGAGGTLDARPNLGTSIYWNESKNTFIFKNDYDIEKASNSNDEKFVYEAPDANLLNEGFVCIRPPRKGNKLGCWTWSIEKFKEEKIIIKNKTPYKKVYIENDNATKEYENVKSFLQISSSNGTKELTEIFDSKVFDNPKPTHLIKTLFKNLTKPNPTVLDFFAGSGTTGQAVMELNAEDGGNRRFILVTNNERSGVDTKAHPEQGIAQAITYERLFRVIKGKGTKGESIKWSSDKDLSKNSLKYLQVKGVDKFEGDFEEIDAERDLYQVEFDKDLDITDFK